MPGYKAHLIGGVLAFAPLYYITTKLSPPPSLTYMMGLFGATLLGSLFPDLDITSKIQRLFYFIIAGAFLFCLAIHEWHALLVTAGLAVIVGILRHRTILHHPLFLAMLPLPIICYMSKNNIPPSLSIPPALFFIAGAWSHLLLDFGLSLNRKKSKKS